MTAPFAFFDLHVLRTERLSPSLARVTFGGAGLACFAAGGRDQSVSLFLPHPGQAAPVLPTGEDWFAEWRALPPDEAAVMRSYTVREQRCDPDEVDIDFVLHGTAPSAAGAAGGHASRWVDRAAPGDRVTVLGPTRPDNSGVRFRLPAQGADWVLVAADATALPAAAAILEWLPAGTPAKVWLEVPGEDDALPLTTAADAEVVWLRPGSALAAVRDATLPEGRPYAWIAGESGLVKTVRRHLVHERGLDRRAVTFTGYWRRGATEDQFRAAPDA